jgi:catechol 2,3-dioxygenase-like lactoylglutathione lyase family enzyme
MIHGAHVIVYSRDAEADRAFFRDVLGFPHVDVGGGWLIFGLPPSEVAVHPSGKDDVHELYLMTDDVAAFVRAMKARGVATGELATLAWGILTTVTLPGGGKVGVYQPRHARPPEARAASPRKASRKAAARKGAARKKEAAPKERAAPKKGAAKAKGR